MIRAAGYPMNYITLRDAGRKSWFANLGCLARCKFGRKESDEQKERSSPATDMAADCELKNLYIVGSAAMLITAS
ncbi:hypothetical protein Y032_0008g343 [Ancylostoma ceylanicum]|uniref:Uncharacterized protein n=1 Tax=Ancylostoma ceylanicum TaxID=53326 RepID=A0A016VMY6_9BILA|nr:hypothetical protein Y032_0008g343 [Ancylostoma ceylanicum]